MSNCSLALNQDILPLPALFFTLGIIRHKLVGLQVGSLTQIKNAGYFAPDVAMMYEAWSSQVAQAGNDTG